MTTGQTSCRKEPYGEPWSSARTIRRSASSIFETESGCRGDRGVGARIIARVSSGEDDPADDGGEDDNRHDRTPSTKLSAAIGTRRAGWLHLTTP